MLPSSAVLLVNYWETPRFTEDFDFTVAANPSAIERIVERLPTRALR
ncbi:MAG: hypothetical protein M5U18_14115 [Dehalococcoidia bacterium]|nr:hypothetical protein [Dehalococcoidia bacterium]